MERNGLEMLEHEAPPRGDSQRDAEDAEEDDDVAGFLMATPPLLLGPCTCGHDLADHLLGDGGAVCRFAQLHTCPCEHFTFA